MQVKCGQEEIRGLLGVTVMSGDYSNPPALIRAVHSPQSELNHKSRSALAALVNLSLITNAHTLTVSHSSALECKCIIVVFDLAPCI